MFATAASGCVSSVLKAFIAKISEVETEFHSRILEMQDEFC